MNNGIDDFGSGHHGMMGDWMGHGAGGVLADFYGGILWLAILVLVITATVWLINDIRRKKK